MAALPDWITAATGVIIALFTGMLWWMAQRRLMLHQQLIYQSKKDGTIFGRLRLDNQSLNVVTLTKVEARRPRGLMLCRAEALTKFDPATGEVERVRHPDQRALDFSLVLAPGDSASVDLAFSLSERSNCNSIRIVSHILVNRVPMSHRTKAATMRLIDENAKIHA